MVESSHRLGVELGDGGADGGRQRAAGLDAQSARAERLRLLLPPEDRGQRLGLRDAEQLMPDLLEQPEPQAGLGPAAWGSSSYGRLRLPTPRSRR